MVDFRDDPVSWLLEAQRDLLKSEDLFTRFRDRILCTQGGEYSQKLSPPLIVLGPGTNQEDDPPRKAEQAVYEAVDTNIHCYTQHAGQERGLFGDEKFIGLLTIVRQVRTLLFDNRLGQPTYIRRVEWLGTTFPDQRDRFNLNTNEGVIAFRYHVALPR